MDAIMAKSFKGQALIIYYYLTNPYPHVPPNILFLFLTHISFLLHFQKSAAAAAAAVAASQSLHRDRSPLRSDPTASLSGVPGSMLSSKGDDDVMMQMSRGLLSPYLSRVPPVASATGRLGSGVGGVGAHLHPSSRGPYPPPPSPWDPYRLVEICLKICNSVICNDTYFIYL